MKMKTILATLLLSFTITVNGIAQKISEEAYNHTEIFEDFSQEGKIFPIINTTKNQFIIDNGDYFLSRNNKDSQYIIKAYNSSFSDFILKTSIRIGPNNNKKAAIGIILKAQHKLEEGAIIFEINKNGEYRIKQLLSNTYKTLNDVSKHEGWIKSKTINGVNEPNIIEIRTENNVFDVYVNNSYLTTFFNQDYTNGSCGLVISPETKARIAYFHLNTKGEKNTTKTTYFSENKSNTNTSIKALNKKTTILEKNNEKLNSLNAEGKENQRLELIAIRKINIDQNAVTIKQETEIASLNRTIKVLKNNNLRIEGLENTTLQNTKNKQDDIVNDLNNQLSLLKAKQLELKSEVKALNKKTSNLETTNIELKELFILKDFEANGVKPSDLIMKTNSYSTPKELKGNGTIYAVQFGVFMKVQASTKLKVLDEVWYEKTEHGTYVYLSGQFKNPKEATEHKNKVAALGYPNAFLVTLRK
tara:strand:+ start:148 stop:1566 length:1419 start_codon:yes stop_codon:yes gene_type:complete